MHTKFSTAYFMSVSMLYVPVPTSYVGSAVNRCKVLDCTHASSRHFEAGLPAACQSFCRTLALSTTPSCVSSDHISILHDGDRHLRLEQSKSKQPFQRQEQNAHVYSCCGVLALIIRADRGGGTTRSMPYDHAGNAARRGGSML
jgi:hypothetical protein